MDHHAVRVELAHRFDRLSQHKEISLQELAMVLQNSHKKAPECSFQPAGSANLGLVVSASGFQ